MLHGIIKREYQIPRLTDLIDISTLQQIQDWAARTAGISILIRDTDGYPVTRASMSSELCNLISGDEHTNPECRESNIKAAVLAARAGSPQKYTCYAGLTQFAAPIQIEGHLLGTIVLGDRPAEPISEDKLKELSDKFGINYEKLLETAKNAETWSDETMNSTINFLYSIANTLIGLCYQGYSLRKKVNELTVLLEISQLLISKLDLQEILDQIAQGIVKAVGVKASTIRLLSEDSVELILKSIYNLSEEYLNKGSFKLKDHPICYAAMSGEAGIIDDVCADPRFPYNKAAKKEGLCSMLCVGMKSKDRAIGTIHLYTDKPHNFTDDEIDLAQSIANQAAVVIENAKLYEESIEKQRIERELIVAGEIQAELLPDDIPDSKDIDIKAKIVPCGHLSGDLYDFIKLDDQCLGLVIADVSGKGSPGAILMATTHANIHAAADNKASPKEVIAKVNNYLCKYTRSTEYVTLFYGIVDMKNSTFTYANAGHNPPIIFRENMGVFLEQGSIPLGIMADIVCEEEQIKLLQGDAILFYTDGVTEAMNSDKDIFGIKNLMRIVQQNIDTDSQGMIEKISNEIKEFAGDTPQSDDLTLVMLKIK